MFPLLVVLSLPMPTTATSVGIGERVVGIPVGTVSDSRGSVVAMTTTIVGGAGARVGVSVGACADVNDIVGAICVGARVGIAVGGCVGVDVGDSDCDGVGVGGTVVPRPIGVVCNIVDVDSCSNDVVMRTSVKSGALVVPALGFVVVGAKDDGL